MKRTIRNFKETIEMQSSLLNRFRSSRYIPIGLLIAAFLTASVVHIWQRVRVLEMVHEVSLLEQENEGLADEVRKVYSDIAGLTMASRIEAYAADSLGLVPVNPEAMFTLVPDGESEPLKDDLDRVIAAVQRIVDYFPTVEQTQANAGELRNPVIDSLAKRADD